MRTVPQEPRVRLGAALGAMRALTRNPDDTAQVFRIIDALSGRHAVRFLEKWRATPGSRRLLEQRPNLLQALTDTQRLRALPEGSLGRAYLEFLGNEGITTEGLIAASVEGRDRDASEELAYVRNRMRDMHDLWHVVTGYHGDLLGEAALLAFSFGQTRNPGIAFIVFIAFARGRTKDARRFIMEGLRRGLGCEWLPAVDWENLLPLPLDEVRARLRVGAPPIYTPYRSSQYFADRAAA
jgi:ubiquinone biosynthesis protein COQ4